MLSPTDSNEGREDHDYHLQRSEDEESNDALDLPVRRRLNNSHDNTDHDYLALQDMNDEIIDVDSLSPAVGVVEPLVAVVVLEPARDAEEQESRNSTSAETSPTLADRAREAIAKKRKRTSNRTPKSSTPKVKALNNDDVDEEDEGLMCPICLDCWEMSGEHRLVSLKCGHLFGESCIRRWLLESARQSGIKACPQCKTKALPRDIRYLYAKRLRAIDRSEEHHLRSQLEEERRSSSNLRLELAGLRMTYTTVMQKVSTLEAENVRMSQLLRSGGSGFGYNADATIKARLLYYKLFMEKNIEISREPGCRVMQYSEKQSSVIASQKSSQTLFPGYGLRFIDVPTFKPSNFLHATAKMVRDVDLNADQTFLVVASMEARSKLFDLRTRQISATFTPSERALWACALDRHERENLLYLGAQNGSTYVYDVRNPETIVEEFKAESDLSPVVNLAPVSVSKHFPCGGFLVCKLQSLWFFEYSVETASATPHRLAVEGPLISMDYDAGREMLLVSARSNHSYPQSRYILGTLEKIGNQPVFNVKVSFFGSKTTPIMTRCSQIAVEANTLIAGYIQDVKLLALFDASREQRLQSMPVHELVYDTCPIYVQSSIYLAALTETKCRIYKLTPTS